MNCLCAIYVDRNQRPFLAHTRSSVVRYDVIYHLSPINSQYLMTWEVASPGNVFLGLTCNSQSLPPSFDKNTIAISFAILNSPELFSLFFLRQITMWFGNPKSLQSLQNVQRDTTNFALNKETLGTFVPSHQGTYRIIPSKPCEQKNTTLYQNRPEATQNWTNLYLEPHDCRIYYVNINLRYQYGISAAESQASLRAKRPQRRTARRNGCFRRLLERHLGKNFSLRTRANPPLQILTIWPCLREVGGVVGKLRYLRRCHMLSPSPFPPFFAHSRFRCSRASFASRSLFSLIYTDRVPGTAYCKPESKIQNPTLQFDLDWQ